MAEVQFTVEEQEYLDTERGVAAPAPEKEVEAAPEPVKEPEEAPPEEVKAEPEEDAPEEEVKAEEPIRKKTPIDTIRELRADRRELRQKLKEQDQFKATAQARLEALELARSQVAAPDPDMDPEGHREHTEKELAALRAEKAERAKVEADQAKQQEELGGLVEYVEDAETEFFEEHPDYFEAIDHAKTAAAKYFMDEFGVTAAVAQDRVLDEIKRMAKETQAMGGNIAHRFYRRAVNEFGWGAKAAEAPGESEEKAPEKQPDASRLKPLADGKQASRNPKGGRSTGQLTVEELVSMTDEEFQKTAGDHKKLRKLFGE